MADTNNDDMNSVDMPKLPDHSYTISEMMLLRTTPYGALRLVQTKEEPRDGFYILRGAEYPIPPGERLHNKATEAQKQHSKERWDDWWTERGAAYEYIINKKLMTAVKKFMAKLKNDVEALRNELKQAKTEKTEALEKQEKQHEAAIEAINKKHQDEVPAINLDLQYEKNHFEQLQAKLYGLPSPDMNIKRVSEYIDRPFYQKDEIRDANDREAAREIMEAIRDVIAPADADIAKKQGEFDQEALELSKKNTELMRLIKKNDDRKEYYGRLNEGIKRYRHQVARTNVQASHLNFD